MLDDGSFTSANLGNDHGIRGRMESYKPRMIMG